MCHRFTMLSPDETHRVVAFLERAAKLMAEGALTEAEDAVLQLPPSSVTLSRIDCYPGKPCEVILREDGALVERELTWGFEVPGRRGLVFNARIESALGGLGMWSEPLREGRCIVPVHAFYETQNVKPREPEGAHATNGLPLGESDESAHAVASPSPTSGTGKRSQFRFSARAADALLLAGLYESDRFALVTTEPNETVAPIHDRMPLVLSAMEATRWLKGSPEEAAAVARHAVAHSASNLESAAAAPAPRKRANDSQLSLF